MTDIMMGSVMVRTNAKPTAEDYADKIMAQLIHVSDTAPDEIKMQVKLFRLQLHDLILTSVREIMENR